MWRGGSGRQSRGSVGGFVTVGRGPVVLDVRLDEGGEGGSGGKGTVGWVASAKHLI